MIIGSTSPWLRKTACTIAGIGSVAGFLFAAGNASAQELDAAELAAEKRCNACHDAERVLLGPPYRAIAARHASERGVMTEVLAQKIVYGGGGNWGVVPMVPNEHVSLEEALAISSWILSSFAPSSE
jgi:cytochrome c